MGAQISAERFESFVKLVAMARADAPASEWAVPATAFNMMLKQGWMPIGGEVDDDVAEFVRRAAAAGPVIEEAAGSAEFSNDELAAIILSDSWVRVSADRGDCSTPKSLVSLAIGLLDLGEADDVADACCGIGSFMVSACESGKIRSFKGVEINYEAALMSRMRAEVLGQDIDIRVGNTFEWNEQYDKLFLNAPMGMSAPMLMRSTLTDGADLLPKDVATRSGDWLFALHAIKGLREGGKAVVVMIGGPLFNASEKAVREYLVSEGLVESVIALPGRLFRNTAVKTNLLVLSQGNGSVALVDATDLGVDERRFTTLSADDIAAILARVKEAHEKPDGCVSAEEIEANDWSLDPLRYEAGVEVPNGVPLGGLLEKITRGAGISARELDERITEEQTPYRYLRIQDVAEGEIVPDLPHLTDIKPNEERYCLQDGDIVLGKMPPFKAALAHIKPGEKILCTGNLYVLRPDKSKATAAYIKLFLESGLGIAQLRAACVGTTIPSVPAKALNEIEVPEKDLELQQRVEKEYEILRKEIAVYKRKIERTRARMADLLELEGEE